MADDVSVSLRAYLAVFTRFVLVFINVGIYKSLGVFLDMFITGLNSSASIVGFSCGLFVGLGNILGR